MDKKSKELLINDLCARLPHGVIVQMTGKDKPVMLKHINIDAMPMMKPYLRTMSSMTDDEREELSHYDNSVQRTDFFYSHHLDCRNMLEDNLAYEALPGMYNIK